METVTDFILGGSKITADGDYSHEIKRHLLLGRKAMTSLDGILESRDITLPTKVQGYGGPLFPRVMQARAQSLRLCHISSGKSREQSLLVEFLIHLGDSLAQIAYLENVGDCQIKCLPCRAEWTTALEWISSSSYPLATCQFLKLPDLIFFKGAYSSSLRSGFHCFHSWHWQRLRTHKTIVIFC